MRINLLDLADREGKQSNFCFSWEADEIRFQSGSFPVLDRGDLRLTIENIGKKTLILKGSGQITVGIPCDRCLTLTRTPISLSFERKLDMRLSPRELAVLLEEDSYLDGAELDADALFLLEILLNWPGKVLCRDDCRGLCPVCGKNLNEGSCSCETGTVDPRMAQIRELFKNSTMI
jgi:uncharacterized protein